MEAGLAVAGVTLAIPPLIELVWRAAGSLSERVKRYEAEYGRLFRLIVRTNKSQTQDIVQYCFNDENDVPKELRDELCELYQALLLVLDELLTVFPAPITHFAGARAPKLSSRGKKIADRSIVKLEDWNDRFIKRAIVFRLFGQHVHNKSKRKAMRCDGRAGGDEHESDDGRELLATRKVERIRDVVLSLLSQSSTVGHCRRSKMGDGFWRIR